MNNFSASDPIMSKLAARFGKLNPVKPHQQDRFAEIVDSIISQQLSGKVASIIYSRFENLFPNRKIIPEKLLTIDDLGIQNAFVKHYGLKRNSKLLKPKMLKIAQKWRPYRIVACWYLWKSLDN